MFNKNKTIVSFLPSATEILYEIGASSQILGVTHECNYPLDAKSKPRVINSSFDASIMSSKEIDNKIIELFNNEKDIYIVNDEILKELKPDIIVAQGICEVCAPFTKEIKRSISLLSYTPKVIILDPHDISDILDNIYEISRNIGKIKEGEYLVNSLKDKINRIKKNTEIKIKKEEDLPKILCLEWLDPFFTAGHWVPDMVEMAGGRNGLSKSKEQSRRTSLEEIKQFDPDKIILMPCGFNINRTLKEYKNTNLNNNHEWNNLRAIKKNELYAVDAGSYFSKPGPRTIIGIEILSKIIFPNEFEQIKVPEKSYINIDTKNN
jgi:iron complex transport system substrate-binding protein